MSCLVLVLRPRLLMRTEISRTRTTTADEGRLVNDDYLWPVASNRRQPPRSPNAKKTGPKNARKASFRAQIHSNLNTTSELLWSDPV
jgi:hypothetical protein